MTVFTNAHVEVGDLRWVHVRLGDEREIPVICEVVGQMPDGKFEIVLVGGSYSRFVEADKLWVKRRS